MSRSGAPARPARPDTRRSELLDAARRVIRRRGFANATVGEITGEAGASLGLLHYHFGSKDDVVAEAFAELAGEELAELEAISRRHADPPARLAAYLDLEGWADRDSWRMWIDAWGEAVHAETLRSTLERFELGWRTVLADVLADGDRAGDWSCPDPVDTAGRLTAALDGIGVHVTMHPGLIPPARAAAWARRLTERELEVTLPDAPPAPPPDRPAGGAQEARIAIRGRDLDATGRVHPAVLLGYLGEAREAWFEARLAALESPPRLEVAHLSADFGRAPARRDAEVLVRCALDGVDDSGVRTRETIETMEGARVVSAGARVVVAAEHGGPRPLSDAERAALLG
jgi:AcrR family transcriptional regulator/acyl-CoA thioesterase FadM